MGTSTLSIAKWGPGRLVHHRHCHRDRLPAMPIPNQTDADLRRLHGGTGRSPDDSQNQRLRLSPFRHQPRQHRPWRRNRCAVDDDELPGRSKSTSTKTPRNTPAARRSAHTTSQNRNSSPWAHTTTKPAFPLTSKRQSKPNRQPKTQSGRKYSAAGRRMNMLQPPSKAPRH